MKKLSLIILLMTLVLINLNCSGGPGSSDNSGKTMVNINLGKISKASPTEKRLSKATSSIPDNVASIRFTISAPDIVTIIRVVSIAGKNPISETFEIPNGQNRDFLIEALDDSGIVLYRKETFVNLDGSPIYLTIEMESTDMESPDFAGLSAINSITETSLTLSWLPGDDNLTPQDKLQYLIYRSETQGGENFASPNFTTGSGITSFPVTGLSPATTYYFVVRAKDETGNIDSNSVEMSATTLSPPDTTAPDFDGIVSVAAVSSTVLDLSWSPAVDNITESPNIVYNIYMSITPGGENLASPNFTTGGGATSYSVTGLSPDTTYYFIVRAKDEAGNIDSNSMERSATTLSPPDTTAPDFGGMNSVAAVSATSLNLSWSPAVDNVTASSKIVYNIYRSTRSGEENLAVPNFTTASGATSYTVTGLSPGTTYYFIVRAKDEAGNIDDNIVEKSGTTQSGKDLSVSTRVTNPCAPLELCPELEITVSNTGNLDATSVQVYYIYEYCIESCYLSCDNRTVSLVAAHGSELVTDLYNSDTGNYFVIVDPSNLIKEINESNNEKCSGTGTFCTVPPPFDSCY